MVRGSVPLIFLVFKWLQTVFSATLHPYITAAWVTGVLVMVTAIIAAYFTEETFGKDLNYTE